MDNVVTGLMVAMLLTMGVAVVIIRMGAAV